MQLCCIPLRDLRYLRENIHIRVLNLSAQRNPNVLPQISLIYADKRQVDQMALLKQMPQISLTKTVTNYSGDIQFILFAVCLRNNVACCIPLRDLRYLRENIHIRVLNLSAQRNPNILPQISLIYADKTQKQQNHIKLTTNPICLSLRDNAACCIPLRNLLYLRENIHIRVLNQFTNKKPQCLPQISLITQTKPKTTTTSQTVFLCEIMQLAAFLCVICAICGRIFT